MHEPFECRYLDNACWRKLKILSRSANWPFARTEGNSTGEDAGAAGGKDMEVDQDAPKEEKKKEAEVDKGQEFNDKVVWDKVQRVIVYEF